MVPTIVSQWVAFGCCVFNLVLLTGVIVALSKDAMSKIPTTMVWSLLFSRVGA
jgi:hypothetical protein